MTNKELENFLLLLKKNAKSTEDTIIQNVKQENFVWVIDEAIKTLKQQPSEDCISREAVRELICQNNDKYGYSDRFHEFTEKCLHLQPVIPQRLKGKWIDTGSGQECSECGEIQYGYDTFRYFCANCGAEMSEDCGKQNL